MHSNREMQSPLKESWPSPNLWDLTATRWLGLPPTLWILLIVLQERIKAREGVQLPWISSVLLLLVFVSVCWLTSRIVIFFSYWPYWKKEKACLWGCIFISMCLLLFIINLSFCWDLLTELGFRSCTVQSY